MMEICRRYDISREAGYLTLRRLSLPHRRAMRSQRPGTHAKSGRQGWRDVAQKISAARAAAFVRSSRRGVRAQPVTPRFAQLVYALNRESRQILHRSPLSCLALEPEHRVSITNSCLTELNWEYRLNVGIVPSPPRRCQQKSTTRYSGSLATVEKRLSVLEVEKALGSFAALRAFCELGGALGTLRRLRVSARLQGRLGFLRCLGLWRGGRDFTGI